MAVLQVGGNYGQAIQTVESIISEGGDSSLSPYRLPDFLLQKVREVDKKKKHKSKSKSKSKSKKKSRSRRAKNDTSHELLGDSTDDDDDNENNDNDKVSISHQKTVLLWAAVRFSSKNKYDR